MINLGNNPQYVGETIDFYESNGYHDSDWYAICWDKSTGKPIHVLYSTTRFAMRGICTLDATPEILNHAADYYREKRYQELFQEAMKRAHEPVIDKPVIIAKKRGKNKGVQGILKRVVKSLYGLRGKIILPNGEEIWDSMEYIHPLEPGVIDTDLLAERADWEREAQLKYWKKLQLEYNNKTV